MSSSENSNSDTDSDYSSDDSYFGNNGNIFNNEIINDKQLLIKKIGYGAFSSVWLSFNHIDYLGKQLLLEMLFLIDH